MKRVFLYSFIIISVASCGGGDEDYREPCAGTNVTRQTSDSLPPTNGSDSLHLRQFSVVVGICCFSEPWMTSLVMPMSVILSSPK